jgi:hypothetical protein
VPDANDRADIDVRFQRVLARIAVDEAVEV